MNEYVENVLKDDGDFVTIPKEDYNRLRQEREEYREIALELSASIPRLHKTANEIDAIIEGGAHQ